MNNYTVLRDGTVRLVGIPALGILIPNVTGLVTNRFYRPIESAGNYLYFVLVSFLVWEGNIRLMYFIRQKYPWTRGTYPKIVIALFLVNVVYSSLVSALLLKGWRLWSREPRDDHGPLVNAVLMIVIAACFIGNIYEILFLNREKEQNESRVEQLNTAKAQAELEALKNQIDPHFIFNSLNTLSFLIARDPKKSAIRSPVQRSASETSITATNSLQKGISSLRITLNRLQSSYRSSGFDTIAGLDCNN